MTSERMMETKWIKAKMMGPKEIEKNKHPPFGLTFHSVHNGKLVSTNDDDHVGLTSSIPSHSCLSFSIWWTHTGSVVLALLLLLHYNCSCVDVRPFHSASIFQCNNIKWMVKKKKFCCRLVMFVNGTLLFIIQSFLPPGTKILIPFINNRIWIWYK